MSNQPVNHSPIVRQQDTGGGAVGFNMTSGPGLPADQMNSSVVSIEQQRAIAEAQGQLVLAKRFPRSFAQAMEELMTSCSYPEFAEEAFYALPRGGQTIRGPSIRLAEEIARCYGNFQYGHRELARNEGESVVEVYAWDVEKNNRSTRQITIPHIMDTKSGGKKLTGQKEITDYIANVASKQMRSRVLALLPKPLVASAIKKCEETLAGGGEQSIQQRLNKMMASFAKYGVSVKMLESYLRHPLADTNTEEITDLIAVFSAIKDGSSIKEFFTISTDAVDDESTQNVKGIITRNAGTAKQQVNLQPTGQTLNKPAADTAAPAAAVAAAAADPQPDPKPDAAGDKSAAKTTRTRANTKADKPAPEAKADKPADQTGVVTDTPAPGPVDADPMPDMEEPPLPEDNAPDVDLTPPPMDIPPGDENDYF